MNATICIRIFCLLFVLSIIACDSTSLSTDQKVDVASLSPRDFLPSPAAGAKYHYKTEFVFTDSNNKVVDSGIAYMLRGQVGEVVHEAERSISRYYYSQDYLRYAAEPPRSDVANDKMLWESDSSGKPINRVLLQKPFVLGAVFNSGVYYQPTSVTRIWLVDGQVTISGKSYQTVATVSKYLENDGATTYTVVDSVWLAVGLGAVRGVYEVTATQASRKSTKLISSLEMTSIDN